LGFGFWVFGFGVWAKTPNPKSPIPNPQSPSQDIIVQLLLEKIKTKI